MTMTQSSKVQQLVLGAICVPLVLGMALLISPELRGLRSPHISASRIPLMDSRYLQLERTLEGYRISQVPLVAYSSGQFEPAGYGDDLGVFYFVPQMERGLRLSLPRSIDLFLGSILLLGFTVGVCGVVYCIESRTGRVIAFLELGALLLLTVCVGDVYVAQSSFAVAAVPWVVYWTRRFDVRKTSLLAIVTLGLVAGIVNFIRIHGGTAVVLFAAIWFCANSAKLSRTLLPIFLMLVGLFTTTKMCNHLVEQRDVFLQAHNAMYRLAAHHVLWHSIYAGLGFLPNDYGLKYEDAVPMAKVQSVDAHVQYLTPEYEQILARAVVRFARTHPGFVVKTVLTKCVILVLVFVISSNIGLISAIRFRKPWVADAAFGAVGIFTALPGLLVVPKPAYMLSLISFGIFYGIFSVEYAYHRLVEPGVYVGNSFLSRQGASRHDRDWEKIHV